MTRCAGLAGKTRQWCGAAADKALAAAHPYQSIYALVWYFRTKIGWQIREWVESVIITASKGAQ